MTAKKSSQIIALGGGGVGLDKFNLAIDNYKIKASGKKVLLKGKVEKIVKSGDRIIIETPGGGGYGVK